MRKVGKGFAKSLTGARRRMLPTLEWEAHSRVEQYAAQVKQCAVLREARPSLDSLIKIGSALVALTMGQGA